MANIRSFKLLTGEELVATLVRESFDPVVYIVTKPLVVHVMRGPDGQGALAFAQWSMVQAPDEEITLFGHALISEPVKLIDEVAKSYIQQTSSILLTSGATNQLLVS